MISPPELTPLRDGEPIFYDGEISGAISVSDAPGEVDQGIAKC